MVKLRNFLFVTILCSFFAGCSSDSEKSAQDLPLRMLLDVAPATLNPRSALDASGQRINALLFRGLTRIDSNLDPQPDLASSWEILDGGKIWKFKIRPEVKDHGGEGISAGLIGKCLDNYRVGKPNSPYRESFPHWIETSVDAEKNTVILRLSDPDVYLARNISLLRYFRSPGRVSPCEEPDPTREIIGSGFYRVKNWDFAPEAEMQLLPVVMDKRPLTLSFVHDENTKALKLLRGEVDVVQNALALTKTKWVQEKLQEKYRVIEREGVSVAYLSFNLRDPLLAKVNVRRAIVSAIDRDTIVRNKFLGFASLAGSFLSPLLPESFQTNSKYDPTLAERLLDQEGFPRRSDGIRFQLHYKTTPTREPLETAQIFQKMLKRVGIDLVVDVVESAVFFASIRKGAFQMYSSRWLGVADGSILFRTLRTGQLSNRVGYSDAGLDQLLDRAMKELNLKKRIELLKQAQMKMAQDLPYFPLWYWNTSVIFNKELKGLEPSQISLSGGLEPLTALR